MDKEVPAAAPIPSLSSVGVISVQDKRISPQALLDELRMWDEGGWDWQIRQLSDFEFAATFPSKESLRMMSSCTSFTLPVNQLVVSVKAASNGSKNISPLSDVWVLIDDVPPSLRTASFLMAFGVLIGKPIEVDLASLSVLGPARLRVWCVDPICIRGSVDVFPAAGGFRLRVRVEGAPGAVAPPPPLLPRPRVTMTRAGRVGGS